MPIYLVRHGESESNREGICCGQGRDVALTQTGIEQAHALGQRMLSHGINPGHIVHSGLQRALQTATILHQHLGGKLTEDAAFKEHDVGQWELQPWVHIAPLWLGRIDPPGGETWQEFELRVKKGLTRWELESNLTLVAHGGTLMMALRHFGLEEVIFDNCHLLRLEKGAAGYLQTDLI